MNKKVEIIITDVDLEGNKLRYDESVKGGMEHLSVGFSASHYGSGSPCDNEKEVSQAVKHCKEWIIREGDIPFIVDKRKKATLLGFMGGG